MAGNRVGRGVVPIEPDVDGFGPALEKGIAKEGGPASKRAGDKVSRAFAGAFAAGVAGLTKSVFDFAGFDKGMNEVFTLMPGITGDAMDQMSEQVKDFATDFKVLPTDVVPALYQSLSAGVPADNVFDFLEVSQKLAKGGVTDLTTAVDGLSSVVNAYGSDVLSASDASDMMFTTVKLGKTNISELSASLFQVIPTAAGLGVTFGDVSASLAAMTLQGVPTSVATTQLRQLLVELSKEGSAAAGVFEDFSGKTFRDFIAGGGNMQDALQIMEKGAADSGVAIGDLFGSVEAGAAALTLTGGGTEAFTNALDAMSDSAGATDEAFATMDQGLGATFDSLKARFAVTMLNIGEAIAPTVGAFGDGILLLLELFGKLPGPMQGIVAILGTMTLGLIAFAKPILNAITLFGKLGKVFSLLASNPWVLVVAALVAITYLIIRNWDDVKRAGVDLYNSLLAVFEGIGNAVAAAWDWVTQTTANAWNAVWNTVSSIGSSVVNFITGIPGAIGDAFSLLADVISLPFRTAFDLIKTLWNNTLGGFGFNVPSWIPFVGGKSFTIPSMAAGGILAGPQLFLGGEYPGAATNPEIVAPQNIMRETVIEALGASGGAGDTYITLEMHVTSEVRDPDFFERRATEMTKVVVRELERTGRGRGTLVAGRT